MFRRAFLRRLLASAALPFVSMFGFARGVKAQAAAPLTRIGFASCAHQMKVQPIWDAIFRYRPELFLMLGDNVYGDDDLTGELDTLKSAYDFAKSMPQFQRLRAEFPHLAIWDDHDYGQNDGGAGYRLKAESKQLFLDFWDVPAADPRRQRDGLYHAVSYGPAGRRVQVILLDTRYFRSPLRRATQRVAGGGRYEPDDDPTKTMLGEAQWAWLEAQLRQPADLRVIGSSVQVVAEGHGWERWGNLPRERQRLYDLIARTKANGVVFISGDRHIGGLYAETADTPYRLIDATSSGINQFWAGNDEPGPNRLGKTYGGPNFGMLDIDWAERSITFAIADAAGQPQRTVTLKLDELQARTQRGALVTFR